MPQLKTERDGPVALVTFHNPPHGLMNAATVAELDAVTAALDADKAVRAVVFTGTNGVFIRHYDVAELAGIGRDLRARGRRFDPGRPIPERDLDRVFKRMETSPKPTIAAVNGTAMGGGLEFCLACDLRLAARGDYRLGPIEITLGLLPGAGGVVKLARLIGAAKAMELCLLGRAFGPDEAAAFGLLSEVVAGDVVGRAMALGHALAAKPPAAVGHIKRLVRESAEPSPADVLARERTLFLDLLVSDSATELMARYLAGEIAVDGDRA